MRVVLDVDTGTDDAGALLLAATHPTFELIATSATWGNCSRDRAARNTLAILRAAGSDAPVHPGAERACGPAPFSEPAEVVMAADGLGGVGVAPPPGASPADEEGAEAIVRIARAEPGSVTLVALAPLTTVAHALRLEPRLPSLLRDLVVMGGAFAVGGNVTAAAEANIGHDPLAAASVVEAFGAPGALASGAPPKLVPLDVTLRAPLGLGELEALERSPQPGAATLHRVWEAIWPTGLLETGREGWWPCHDLLATWALVDPGCFVWQRAPLAVDVGGSAAWGATVVDRRVPRFEAWAERTGARTGSWSEAGTISLSRWDIATRVDGDRHRAGVRAWLGAT